MGSTKKHYLCTYLCNVSEKYFLVFSGEKGKNSKKVPISPTRILRRKRCAIGSMEDLWDENIFAEEPIRPQQSNNSVLNIPAIMDNFQDAKAAKKALKKARKEAKKFANSKHKHKKNKKHKKTKIHSETKSSTKIIENHSIIKPGDVVWAKETDTIWWPARVKFKNGVGDGYHVELYNRDHKILSTANLIKPFLNSVSIP